MIHLLALRHCLCLIVITGTVAACGGSSGPKVTGRQYLSKSTWAEVDPVMQRGPMLIEIHRTPFPGVSRSRLDLMVVAAAEQATAWAVRSRFTTNPERTADLAKRVVVAYGWAEPGAVQLCRGGRMDRRFQTKGGTGGRPERGAVNVTAAFCSGKSARAHARGRLVESGGFGDRLFAELMRSVFATLFPPDPNFRRQ